MRQRSWVESANDAACGFPLENLPYCAFAFRPAGTAKVDVHLGVGIGGEVLDLNLLSDAGLLSTVPWELRSACRATRLNRLMRCEVAAVRQLRTVLIDLLSESVSAKERERVRACLRPMEETVFEKPVKVGNYTDFYASIHHATRVGRLYRADHPLLENYKWVPIGYHGRASSVVISGTPVVRPCGQRKPQKADAPEFGPSQQLDYEVELAAYIGMGNPRGVPIPISEAEERIFGYTLLNDWSARDIQAWEYQPLGPFLGKSFATTISPWVVTAAALAPFRVPLNNRPSGDPAPLAYLAPPERSPDVIDVQVEVYLSSRNMREAGMSPMRLSTGNARDLYWSFAQMVAHHTSNGCNLQTGDLLASGTISGAEDGMEGCLLERMGHGENPLRLPTGEIRTFLEDEDEVILRGFCERPGLPRIGWGECSGRVAPAKVCDV